MSRQLEALQEQQETKRQTAAIKALEFDLAGAVQFMGGKMVGFAVKFDDYECLLTYKAEFEGKRMVAFVGSDTPLNCIVKAVNMAKNGRLRWKTDKYGGSDT